MPHQTVQSLKHALLIGKKLVMEIEKRRYSLWPTNQRTVMTNNLSFLATEICSNASAMASKGNTRTKIYKIKHSWNRGDLKAVTERKEM